MTDFIPKKPISQYSDAQIAALSPSQKLEASRTLLAAGHNYEDIEKRFGANEATSSKGRAQAEKNALKNDKAFVKRYLDGDVDARKKMAALDRIIST